MKHLKTPQELNEASENLNISDVSESISITKDELLSFLEDWDDGKKDKWDADWNDKSIRIADFLGLIDDVNI
jgi:hypothetical protein